MFRTISTGSPLIALHPLSGTDFVADSDQKFDEQDLPSLDEFGARLDKATPKPPAPGENGAALGQGMKIASEMIAAFLVGGALGYGADKLFESGPWGLIIGFGIGFAAGARTAYKSMLRMDAEAASQDADEIKKDDA